jgi:hypothetical protein
VPQGSLSKAYAGTTPRLARRRLPGEALSTGPPVHHIRRQPDLPTTAALIRRRPRVDDCLTTSAAAARGFAALFGDAALSRRLSRLWGTEPFAPGGPTAAVPLDRGQPSEPGPAAGRPGLLGGHRDLRRVDRFPRRRGALGAAGGGEVADRLVEIS